MNLVHLLTTTKKFNFFVQIKYTKGKYFKSTYKQNLTRRTSNCFLKWSLLRERTIIINIFFRWKGLYIFITTYFFIKYIKRSLNLFFELLMHHSFIMVCQRLVYLLWGHKKVKKYVKKNTNVTINEIFFAMAYSFEFSTKIYFF